MYFTAPSLPTQQKFTTIAEVRWASADAGAAGSDFQRVFGNKYGQSTSLSVGASLGRTGGVSNIGSDSQTWGQPIPITWGKVKISGVMLQMLPVRQQITLLRTIAYTTGNKTNVWGADYGTYYYTDFAIGLGYSGDSTRRKIVNRLWVDGELVFQANSPAARKIDFAFYPESETEPVAYQISAGSIDPVAYRGLNYFVLVNFALKVPGSAVRKVPRVDVEFFDYAITATPRTSFAAIDPLAPGPGVGNSNSFYDWEAALLYTVDSNDIIHKWNVVSGQEVDQYEITGKPAGWTAVGAVSASTAFIKINGKRYITAEQDNGSNVNHFVVINLDTGAVTDVFGLTETGGVFFSNDYGGDKIANQNAHLPMTTGIAGTQRAFVLMPTLGGGEYLWEITEAGALRYLGHDNVYPRPKSAAREGIVNSDTGATYFIVSREPSSGGAETTDVLILDQSGRASYGASLTASGLTLVAAFATADGCVVLFETNGSTTNQIRKINPQTGDLVRSLTGGSCPPIPTSPSPTWQQSNTQGKTIGWLSISGNTFYSLDMLTMVVTSWTLSPTPTVTGQPIFDAIDNRFYDSASTGVAGITVSPQDTTRVPLASVLTGMCVRAGYASGDVVVENIDDQITGAILPAAFSLRTVLNDLKTVYRFRIIERDGKIVLSRRARGAAFGNADWIVFEEDRCALDTIGEDEGSVVISIRSRRATDSRVPAKVSITYIDEAYNYEASTYTYSRPDGTSSSQASASYVVPIVMTQAEAAALAARMTYDEWSGRLEHSFRLPQKFLAMEPGDTINLYRDGFVDLVEVVELSVNGDFSIDVTAVSITSTEGPTYDPGEMTNPVVEQPILYGDGRTDVIVIDCPPILPTQVYEDTRSPVYYALINAGRGQWPGASLYFAEPGAGGYSLVSTATIEAITGRALAALSDTGSLGIDRTAAGNITVRFTTGDKARLATVTTDEMLAGKNRVLIGAAGRWEIIGFETVTQNADGTTTLSGTLRGLRGTDVFMGSHLATDQVVYVDTEARQPVLQVSDVVLDGEAVTVKAGFDDTVLRTQVPTTFTTNVNGRKPFAPMNPRATASVNDIIFTWNRRTRRGETMIDDSDFQVLDESAEQYEIDIYSGSTIVRTVTGLTSETYTYTSANQTTDGFTPPQASIKVAIYQVSPVAGRGFARSVTLDVE
jgi:hypothetical protein